VVQLDDPGLGLGILTQNVLLVALVEYRVGLAREASRRILKIILDIIPFRSICETPLMGSIEDVRSVVDP
jgi:hypothetical protein